MWIDYWLDLNFFLRLDHLSVAVRADITVALLAIAPVVPLLDNNIDGASVTGKIVSILDVAAVLSQTWERHVFSHEIVTCRTNVPVSFEVCNRNLYLLPLLSLLPELVVLR